MFLCKFIFVFVIVKKILFYTQVETNRYIVSENDNCFLIVSVDESIKQILETVEIRVVRLILL